jgi:two-component system, NtrC family, sensor kinase
MESGIDFEKLYGVLRAISASIDSQHQVKPVLETVVKEGTEILRAKGALIRFRNTGSRQLELMAAYGLSKQYLLKGPVVSENRLLNICNLNQLVIYRDIFSDPRIQYPQEAWREGIRMILDAPLKYDSDFLGLIRFFFSESREFSTEELNFILLIAERTATTIHRALVLENQQSQYDRLVLQTEKLSALGRMAAGIAHEINNPLAGILLFSTSMLKKAPSEGPIKEGLEIIIQETIRCKAIIQDLLEFSREREPQKTPADINQVIEKGVAILKNELRLHQIRLEKELADQLPKILIDENQIQQVVVNLLLNAIQAIGKQGVITIRTGVSPSHKFVNLEVSDSGCGILPEHLPKIFDPFFSTKPKGTGLGLAVTFGIVQKHGGQIHVESRPGLGTGMFLDFPVHTEEAVSEDREPL